MTEPGNRVSVRLVGVNIALLAVLVVVTIAGAQPGAGGAGTGAGAPAGRGRGEYTMVAGKIQGATTSAVYVIDAANQEVVALGWDRSNNRFDVIGHRNLVDDAKYLTKPR